MHADTTFPFTNAQTRTIPSYSSAYNPASAYNPSSAFRSTPFGEYVPPVANVFADARFSRANPLNGPPPNFGVFERRGSPAQRPSSHAYTRPKPGPIARSKSTTSSEDVRPKVNSQTNSPVNRVHNAPPAPHFFAAPAPRFPINFAANPFNADVFQPTPPATPRFNLGASAASPVARMPQAEASHEKNANRGRPVFTNPFDNNKVILEDTWSELGSTTCRQDVGRSRAPNARWPTDPHALKRRRIRIMVSSSPLALVPRLKGSTTTSHSRISSTLTRLIQELLGGRIATTRCAPWA